MDTVLNYGSYFLTILGTALAMAAMLGPKLLALLEAVEASTDEGTKIDSNLDTAIRWIQFVLVYATVQNSTRVKAAAAAISRKPAGTRGE